MPSQSTHSPSGPKAKKVKLIHTTSRTAIGGLAADSSLSPKKGTGVSKLALPLKKGTSFADLPPELHLMIWEMAMDLPASIVSVGARLVMRASMGLDSPDREIMLEAPGTSSFNRWQWAQRMTRHFFHAQLAVQEIFGTAQQCRDNKLRSVRPDKDIVLYIFKSVAYKNYSWQFTMDKAFNRRFMSPRIQKVALLWDHFKTSAFRCHLPSHTHGNVNICPDELASFLDSFSEVKHVYIMVLMRVADTKCRSQKGLINKMNTIISMSHLPNPPSWP